MKKERGCAGCGHIHTEGEPEYSKIESGKYYCPSCLERNTEECGICKKRHYNNYTHARQIYMPGGVLQWLHVCKKCLSKDIVRCEHCGTLILKEYSEAIKNPEGKILCPECLKEYHKCEISGDFCHEAEMRKIIMFDKSFIYIKNDLWSPLVTERYKVGQCCLCGNNYSKVNYDDVIINRIEGHTSTLSICPIHKDEFVTVKCNHREHKTQYHIVSDSFMQKLNVVIERIEGTQKRDSVDIDGIPLSPSEIFAPSYRPGYGSDSTTRVTLTRVTLPPSQVERVIQGHTPSEMIPFAFTKHLKKQNIKQGDIICNSCFCGVLSEFDYTLLNERGNGGSFVNSNHSYSPGSLFFHGESERKDDLFMGFELEVDCYSSLDLNAIAKRIYKNVGAKHVFIKRDGSLSHGFEQVTHPSTLKYMMENRTRYENLLKIPKESGMLSHDIETCGLHVHIDRTFYGEISENRKIKLCQLGVLTELFWPELFIFSRRKGTSDMHWAKRMFNISFQAKIIATGNIEKMMEEWFRYIDHAEVDRYRTLNMNRSNTAEFRIFRGTLNPITFWATLQLVDNMVKINKETHIADILKLKWLDIINYARYTELLDYNSRMIGEGWDGKKKIKIMQLADENSRMVTLEIPQSIDKNNIKIIKYITLMASSMMVKMITKEYGLKFIKEGEMWAFVEYGSSSDEFKRLTNIPIDNSKIKLNNDGSISVDNSDQNIYI